MALQRLSYRSQKWRQPAVCVPAVKFGEFPLSLAERQWFMSVILQSGADPASAQSDQYRIL